MNTDEHSRRKWPPGEHGLSSWSLANTGNIPYASSAFQYVRQRWTLLCSLEKKHVHFFHPLSHLLSFVVSSFTRFLLFVVLLPVVPSCFALRHLSLFVFLRYPSFFNLCSRLYPLALSVFRCLSFFRPSNLHFLYLQSVSVPFNLIFLSSLPPFPLVFLLFSSLSLFS